MNIIFSLRCMALWWSALAGIFFVSTAAGANAPALAGWITHSSGAAQIEGGQGALKTGAQITEVPAGAVIRCEQGVTVKLALVCGPTYEIRAGGWRPTGNGPWQTGVIGDSAEAAAARPPVGDGVRVFPNKYPFASVSKAKRLGAAGVRAGSRSKGTVADLLEPIPEGNGATRISKLKLKFKPSGKLLRRTVEVADYAGASLSRFEVRELEHTFRADVLDQIDAVSDDGPIHLSVVDEAGGSQALSFLVVSRKAEKQIDAEVANNFKSWPSAEQAVAKAQIYAQAKLWDEARAVLAKSIGDIRGTRNPDLISMAETLLKTP